MLVVGLTGGIGSGKTTVANLFAEHGIPIIDADIVARELTEPSQPAFARIIDHFGKSVLRTDGYLDRAQLRNIIFSHPAERHWLEELLHPLIRHEIEKQIKHVRAPYCIAVIPLLLEREIYDFINRILVVDTPLEVQIARATIRDHQTQSDIEAILKTQASREMRNAKAHDIIINDGTIMDLFPQVERLHLLYLKMTLNQESLR